LNTRIKWPLRKNMLGTEIFIRKPSVLGFPAAVDLEDLRRYTVSLLRLRPISGMRSFSPRPQGTLDTHMDGLLPANALPGLYFSAVRRQLQRPPPTQIRPCPPRRQKSSEIEVPSVDMNVFDEYLASKRSIGLAERKILTPVVHIIFESPP
jgi:hypothetical protein